MSDSLFDSTMDLFRLAVERSPSGMLVTDAQGRIVLVNSEVERLFGYSRDELLGQPVELLVPARLRDVHAQHRSSFYAQPQTRPMGAGRDLFGRRKDGTEVPVEIGLNPIPTKDGYFVLSTIVDISARRELEERLRQAQKMEAIGTLAGGIAHDFNNILRAIVGYSELALAKMHDAQGIEDLAQVRRAAERGQQLVQRILAFSRQRELVRTPVRVERSIVDAIGLLQASLPRTLEIRTYFAPDAPPVRADETQLHQILMNLATNSAQAIGDRQGVIEVTLAPFRAGEEFERTHPGARPGLYTRLVVADDGPGMTPEVRERALEPFFTTKPPGSGTGLGLAVVHGIVQALGGFIEIQSSPGEGTTVSCYFPAAEQTVEVSSAEDPAQTGPHILFVEDEEALADLGKRQLQAEGFRVTVHTSSLRALEDFRSRPDAFDLVVTDNTMPRMSGMALAQEILRLRPRTRILLVSGLAETLDPGVIHAKGIAGLLGKPHSGQDLANAVRSLLGSSPGSKPSQ
ncbi:MAG TPA: PAS domain S-box protein [Vicinamibacterales bacterium]|nr:PAS domain S-box protein [Vicinamibacterales bacterium]